MGAGQDESDSARCMTPHINAAEALPAVLHREHASVPPILLRRRPGTGFAITPRQERSRTISKLLASLGSLG